MAFIQQAIGIIVQVLDAAWVVSMGVVPVLCLAFPVAYLYLVDEDRHTAVFEGYRALTLRYGLYVMTGALVAAGVGVILGFAGAVLQIVGAVVVAGFLAYGLRGADLVQFEYPDATGWRRWLPYGWFGVFLVSLAAVLTLRPVLQSLSAVAFYSYVFWRL